MLNKRGIILVNLGTPDKPEATAVKKYLKQFLSDPRVVELPRLLWLPLLNGIILPLKSRKSALKYKKIWQEEGSPLKVIGESFLNKLNIKLANDKYVLLNAMTYGSPSIPEQLESLRTKGINDLLIIPLFPQYSATTTAAIYDQVADYLKSQRDCPSIRIQRNYCEFESYIHALSHSINRHWENNGRGDRLMFSFHGIPEENVKKGDPYPVECRKLAEKVTEQLNLSSEQWEMCFQSRFGFAKWLQPYLNDRLSALPNESIKKIDIIAPSFAFDCLETLEEIKLEGAEVFKEAGGEQFNYINCLNDTSMHVEVLQSVIASHFEI